MIMKRKIVSFVASFVILFGLAAAPVMAAPCTPYNPSTMEILVPWYKYLPGDNETGKCRVALPQKRNDATNEQETDIVKSGTLISIAIIELLTRISALIAVGYIIYGAFQYITSQGEPQGLSNAKSTIANALVGFVIVVLAIGIVQFIGRAISY